MKKFTYFILPCVFVLCFATQSIGQCLSQSFEGAATDTWTYMGTPTISTGNGTLPATSVASDGLAAWTIQAPDGNVLTETINLACVDITGLQGVTISFDYAGFANNTSNGIDGGDDIFVDISLDGGGIYSEEVEIQGSGANNYWSHGTGGSNAHTYMGGDPSTNYPSATGAGPSAITITIPDCRVDDNLCVRIRADNNRTTETWAIDNIVLNTTSPTCVPGACAITNVAAATTTCNGDDAEIIITWTEMNSSGTTEVDVNGNGFVTMTSGGTYTITGPTTAMTGVTVTVRDECDNTCMATTMVNIPECPSTATCGFPEPVITLEEDCGTYNIIVGAIDESGASGTGTVVTFTTAPVDPTYPVVGGTAVTGTDALAANGTSQIWIQICDVGDTSCCSEFGPFTAPVGKTPDCGMFPANPE